MGIRPPLDFSLVADAIRALDPSSLMRDLGLDPDPWQERMLDSQAQRVLLLATRQCGKSTTTAALALHTILYRPGALVVMLSPSQRQSGELYLKVRDFYDRLDRPIAARKETETTLALANGSRVVSLPGSANTVRSYSAVHTTIIDEAALINDELIAAVSPMRATSRGRLILLSSPKGQRGYFYEQWEHGGEDWERFRITADECPRISREFLAEERRNLGDTWFFQEYYTVFNQAIDQVFATDLVNRAFSSRRPPLFQAGGSFASSYVPALDSAKAPLIG